MQNIKAETEFFDTFVQEVGDYDVFDEKGWNRLLKIFENSVNPKPGERLIDLGCGTGAFTRRLMKYGLELFGIDISQKSIEYASRLSKGQEIKFIVGNIEQLPFPNESFDLVVLGAVLHHFLDFSKVVQETYRILKDKGRFFSFDPNRRNPAMWLFRDKKSPFYSEKGRTINERLLVSEGVKQAFEKAGFTVRIKATSGITYQYVKGELAKRLIPFYNFLENYLAPSVFSSRYGSFLTAWGYKKV